MQGNTGICNGERAVLRSEAKTDRKESEAKMSDERTTGTKREDGKEIKRTKGCDG